MKCGLAVFSEELHEKRLVRGKSLIIVRNHCKSVGFGLIVRELHGSFVLIQNVVTLEGACIRAILNVDCRAGESSVFIKNITRVFRLFYYDRS